MEMQNSLNQLETFVDSCYKADILLSRIAENVYQLHNNSSDNRIICNHQSFDSIFFYPS